MAGKFETSKYEADDGTIYGVTVQPETEQAALGTTVNDPPAGAVTGKISARVGGGNRQIGIKCRSVSIKWNGTAPSNYDVNGIIRIPVLVKATYDAIPPKGGTGTYLGQTFKIIGKQPERVR